MQQLLQPGRVWTRRDVLQMAAACGLSFALPALEPRAAQKRRAERPKSLVTVWLGGGPSQLETWDPHPGTWIGGETRDIPTAIPGLRIADLFPQTAEQIDCLSVIRSLVSKEGDHERGTYYLKTGFRPDPTLVHPSLGAIVTHELESPGLEIPGHVSLGDGNWPSRGGFLGAEYDAFRVFDPGRNLRNMQARVAEPRQERRLRGLELLTQDFRSGRDLQVRQTQHEQTVHRALTMMTSEQLKAFDLDEEPEAVRERYGETRFGRGCLVARRLLETGVRAIEVSLPGFDTHADNYSGHVTQAAILDPAFATLLKELRERELLESTIVLCIGEFGRTPEINKLGGRDHHPVGFSCLVGGGGLRNGVVIGETDPQWAVKEPAHPIAVESLFATVMAALEIDYGRERITPIGRPMAFSYESPIPELWSPPA